MNEEYHKHECTVLALQRKANALWDERDIIIESVLNGNPNFSGQHQEVINQIGFVAETVEAVASALYDRINLDQWKAEIEAQDADHADQTDEQIGLRYGG